jgi:flagellar basal-body rod modification protein FlgD
MEIATDPSRTQQPSVASAATSNQAAITADFEMFLQMLTAQLKNQDPLNPMESTEYATQLATFSGVEQQVRTNELLETLTNGSATQGIGQLSGWIGMQAAAEMPVAFSGAPVTVQTTPAARADRLELSCRRRRIGGAAASDPAFGCAVRMDRNEPSGRDAAAGHLFPCGRELGR